MSHEYLKGWQNSYTQKDNALIVSGLSMSNSMKEEWSEFDKFAAEYEALGEQALSITGENRSYFIQGRIARLAGCLRNLQEQPKSMLDFGCGTGSGASSFRPLLGVESILGVDISAECLEEAKRSHGSQHIQFLMLNRYQPREEIDLVFCHGVFHHMPLNDRAAAINYVYRCLRRGGLFAFWENNPWNPGTRYVMHRTPWDRNAITIKYCEAQSLLRGGGFQIVRTDFLFFLPRMLSWFRGIEPFLSRLPMGGQYQVLCRKL